MLARWRRMLFGAALPVLSSLGALTVRAEPPKAPSLPARSSTTAAPSSTGRLKLVTYNVAGLPEGLSRSRPVPNLPVIGELLNHYGIALVQEDFAYPELLRLKNRHPHASAPFARGERLHFGDGLSHFSALPFNGFTREPWSSCHGVVDAYFDCLTPKGFSFARHELGGDVDVDVYNLHMDAGGSQADRAARAAQIQQLARRMRHRSAGRAVIVAGDFNLWGAELEHLRWLERELSLRDVCTELDCAEPWRIDRVLYRSSETLRLSARSWRTDRRFVDARRRPLSDHLAVAVELDWLVPPPPARTASR